MKIVNAEKILVDKLSKKCENIDENKLIYNGTVNDYGNLCNSCTIYNDNSYLYNSYTIFFYSIISHCFFNTHQHWQCFIYFHWYLKRGHTYVNTSANTDIKTGTMICQTYKWDVSNKLIYKNQHFNSLMT